ncbi:MAG TPA: hypothetical protein VNE62_09650 [Actinomycetota bacterium]|nr:hypothetical protein [Actinomycetota bacterium]
MRKLLILVLVVSFAATGCRGKSPGDVLTGAGPVDAPTITFPSQILGLQTKLEDVSKIVKRVDRPYIDSLAVFSLREGELLRATLQISRFNRLARPKSPRFRSTVIGLLGSTKPQVLKVEDTVIYSTGGNQQNVFAWFENKGLFVLSVHRDFVFPRTLLRKVLKLDVGI